MLREDDLDLVKAIKICRAYEQSNKQVKEIRDSTQAPQKVNKISNKAKSNRNKPKAQGQTQQKSKPKWQPLQRGKGKSCDFCGYKHQRIKEKYPAWGKTCDNCKGRNHFKVKCKKVHSVSLSGDKTEDNSDDDYWLASIESGPKEAITAVMQVNDCSVRGGGRVVRWYWVSFQYRGVLLIWSRGVGQGPTALAVGAGGGCLDIFSLLYHFFFLSPSLWETAQYRLKYCFKGPLSPKTTNQMFCSIPS